MKGQKGSGMEQITYDVFFIWCSCQDEQDRLEEEECTHQHADKRGSWSSWHRL